MAQFAEEWTTSFARGMSDSKAAAAYTADEAALLLNCRVTPNGEAEVRSGSRRTHPAVLNGAANGWGGVEFRLVSGAVQWVAFVGDKMYYSADEGATWVNPLAATGLHEDFWSLVTMRVGPTVYLLCANGGPASYSWDGTNWVAIAGIEAGARRLAVHNDRLWAYASGIVVRGSKIADFNTWAAPDGVSLTVQTHDDATPITALYSVGAILLVFKRRTTSYIDGYGNSDLIVAAGAKGISRDVGCIAFRSIAACGSNALVWLSERGFEFWLPGSQPVLVSAELQRFTQETIGWEVILLQPGLPTAVFYSRKLTYECAVPSSAGSNDWTFVYKVPVGSKPGAASLLQYFSAGGYTFGIDADGYLTLQLNTLGLQGELDANGYLVPVVDGGGFAALVNGGAYFDLINNPLVPRALFMADLETSGEVPVAVGGDGYVRLLDLGLLDDVLSDGSGGAGVEAQIKARPHFFRSLGRRKRARVLRVRGTALTPADISVQMLADGTPGALHAKILPVGESRVFARVGGRGDLLQPFLQTSAAGLRVSAIGVTAELMESLP